MMRTGPLRSTSLAKSFDGVHALRDVSFGVFAGELVALIGPNGAGKTTCFNCINGQLRPDAGRVTLAGTDITGRSPRDIALAGVGRTFQVAATFASMTVRENVDVALLRTPAACRRCRTLAASTRAGADRRAARARRYRVARRASRGDAAPTAT